VLSWREDNMVLGASFFNKRLHLQIRRPAAIPFILADRGGEGEEGRRAVAASSGRWFVESALPAASVVQARPCTPVVASSACGVLQQRQLCAAVICGHRGPSALGFKLSPSYFFLQALMPKWRIFDLRAGYHAGVAPSGYVPGGGAGAQSLRSSGCCGEDDGLDRFLSYFLRVQFVKSEDCTFITSFPRVLLVIMYAPHK
jgi:hypothetical protein